MTATALRAHGDGGASPVSSGGTPGPRARAAVGRIESLDGLRGVAALVVVVFHVAMTVPAWADAYRSGVPAAGTALWWATHTPLRLGWAGREAVLVFFVLSGLVLTLPALARPLQVPAFYVRRLVRLLVPVWAALALAAAWALLVPRRWAVDASWWVHAEGGQLSWDGLLRDAFLLVAPGDTLHPLWSLQWELLFCLALPAVLHLQPVARRHPWAAAMVLLGVLGGGVATDRIAAVALACFLAGALLAVHHEALRLAAGRVSAHPAGRWVWMGGMAAALGLLSVHWMVHQPGGAAVAPAVTRAAQGVGAVALVVVVWLSPLAARALTAPAALRLGDRSFSLYLIHYPVVMALAVVAADAPWPLVLAVALGTTLSLAAAFHRWVEQPSYRLARRAGAAVSTWTAPAARPTGQVADPARGRPARGLAAAALITALAAALVAAPLRDATPHPDPIADLPEAGQPEVSQPGPHVRPSSSSGHVHPVPTWEEARAPAPIA